MLQDANVERHEQAHRDPCQAQVRDDLREMDGLQALDGLELEQNAALDDQVGAVPAVHMHPLVRERQGLLTFEGEPT